MRRLIELIYRFPPLIRGAAIDTYALVRALREFDQVVRRSRQASGGRYFSIAVQLFRLNRRHGFTPSEAFFLGLLGTKATDNKSTSFISKGEFIRIQRSVNPVGWDDITEDKGIFYRYCGALGLAIPQLFAIVFRDRSGWTLHGRPLQSAEEWIDFLCNHCPPEFVVKPSRGAQGRGVEAISRRDGHFVVEATGERLPADAFLKRLFAKRRDQSVVVQERLEPHPVLAHASGSTAVQTVRFMTMVDETGAVRLLGALLKIVAGSGVIDNFNLGVTNNLIARVDVRAGTIEEVVRTQATTPGFERISSHPVTGVGLVGLAVPHWKAAVRLSRDAAIAFAPVRTVGWDVAITPSGPKVIEGNVWWDPPNLTHSVNLMADSLKNAA